MKRKFLLLCAIGMMAVSFASCGLGGNKTHEHTVEHAEAKAATCAEAGNIEYWYCTDCDDVWSDEALTQKISKDETAIEALAHEYTNPCDAHCANCGELTNDDAAHNIAHVEAVEPGCHYAGNVEYWYCTDCGSAWTDDELTQVTNIKSVILPATGSDLLVHMDAVAPACHYNGNIEYWVCYECEQVWADEALTQLTNIMNVILPATGGEVVHVEAVAPTADTEGNIEYWYCEACEQVWQNEALTQLTNFKNVILPATGGEVEHTHNPVHFDAIAPACHYNGNIEYWVCYECEMVWQDEALTQLTNIKNVVLPATGGEVVHFEAVEPTCHYDGNIEYWVCYTCEQVWADEALTQLTNIKNVVLPATGGEVVHFEAIEPACHYNGNIEYWVCYECEQVWANEALTQLTNIKNVILPALGGEVVHVEATEPTCSTEGNIEYWYCESCEQVWQNEELTQLTNFKNVKLGTSAHSYTYACDKNCALCFETTNPDATHTVVYAEAVAPSCTAMGNIEYWYCSDCGTAWTDSEQTQLTNMMSVKLGTVDHTGHAEDFVCDVCSNVVEPADGTTLTYAQANTLGLALGTDKYTTNKYYVTGYISSVYQTTYGNMYIFDEEGNEYCIYGTYSADGSTQYNKLSYKPVKGDKITAYGIIGNYKGAPQMKNGWLTEIIEHTECTWLDATCLVPQTCKYCGTTQGTPIDHTYADGICSGCGKEEGSNALINANISFANTANRTVFTTSQQVWEQNGITVTNNKASSTNNVADFAAPARFYANSQLIIEGTGMKTIAFTCNSSSYATALKNSIGTVSGATVTVSGSIVTVVFETEVDQFNIAKLTAQVRVNSILING